jgi:exopolyphosphatase/guanosine-5'-triphosphate,3'-diphosphate pyrophosphatase
MIFASIDIGSNAARLLFANVFEDKKKIFVEKATLVRIPTRLGEDVYSIGKISSDKAENLIKTLNAFKLLIEVYHPLDWDACATAAMREASNGPEILHRIKAETGIELRTIDGIEEANLIRRTNKIGFIHPHNFSIYIDVGGGSTEISIQKNEDILDVKSFKIGTLRLLSDKVEKSEWKSLNKWLNKYSDFFGRIRVVGSGGNINKLQRLFGSQDSFIMTYDQLNYAYKFLKEYSLLERIEKLGLRPDRADVIVPAAKIFLFILKTINASSLTVPRIGLADGLVYQLYEKYKSNNPEFLVIGQ